MFSETKNENKNKPHKTFASCTQCVVSHMNVMSFHCGACACFSAQSTASGNDIHVVYVFLYTISNSIHFKLIVLHKVLLLSVSSKNLYQNCIQTKKTMRIERNRMSFEKIRISSRTFMRFYFYINKESEIVVRCPFNSNRAFVHNKSFGP